jgi:hypothetical protein
MADGYFGRNPNIGKSPHVGVDEMRNASADRLPERFDRWAYRTIIPRLRGKSV